MKLPPNGPSQTVESDASAKAWFVYREDNGLEQNYLGPYSFLDIRDWIEDEELDSNTPVWSAGMSAWRPACEVLKEHVAIAEVPVAAEVYSRQPKAMATRASRPAPALRADRPRRVRNLLWALSLVVICASIRVGTAQKPRVLASAPKKTVAAPAPAHPPLEENEALELAVLADTLDSQLQETVAIFHEIMTSYGKKSASAPELSRKWQKFHVRWQAMQTELETGAAAPDENPFQEEILKICELLTRLHSTQIGYFRGDRDTPSAEAEVGRLAAAGTAALTQFRAAIAQSSGQ